MPKKERSFAQKMGHQKQDALKDLCPVCKTELRSIIYIADTQSPKGHWSPRRQRVKVCNCNKKEIYE
jgi:hypothetical protein